MKSRLGTAKRANQQQHESGMRCSESWYSVFHFVAFSVVSLQEQPHKGEFLFSGTRRSFWSSRLLNDRFLGPHPCFRVTRAGSYQAMAVFKQGFRYVAPVISPINISPAASWRLNRATMGSCSTGDHLSQALALTMGIKGRKRAVRRSPDATLAS